MTELITLEKYAAQEELMRVSSTELKDKCLRAYGVLTNCAILPLSEFKEKMSEVRFGAVLDIFEMLDRKGFNDLFNDMRPASFRLKNGLETASERDCDVARAEIVGNVLRELVLTKRK